MLDKRKARMKAKADLMNRKSSAVKKRMQVLAGMTVDKLDLQEEELDTFGSNDRDWDVYRQVQIGTSDDANVESEEEKVMIQQLEGQIAEYEPHRLAELGIRGTSKDMMSDKEKVARYYQIDVNVESIRVIFPPFSSIDFSVRHPS
jgi:hypothetical protein